MKKSTFVVHTTDHRQYDDGRIFSSLHLKLRDVCFPAEDWTDFSSIVAPLWGRAAVNLVEQPEESQEFDFFDGPFSFLVENIRSHELKIILRKTVSQPRRKIVIGEF